MNIILPLILAVGTIYVFLTVGQSEMQLLEENIEEIEDVAVIDEVIEINEGEKEARSEEIVPDHVVLVVDETTETKKDDVEEDYSQLQEKIDKALVEVEQVQKDLDALRVEKKKANTNGEEIEEQIEVQKTEVLLSSERSFEEIVEAKIHELTNNERSKQGLSILVRDTKLDGIARGHNVDMYARDFFKHTNPDGCDVTCRIYKSSYNAWAWGENIAWRKSIPFPDTEELAELFVEGWMNSSGHRANILHKEYTNHGIDVYRIENEAFATANFSKPR